MMAMSFQAYKYGDQTTMRPTNYFRFIPIGILLVNLLLQGCSREEIRGRIIGKVTFQSKPVSEGLVVFNNAEKGIYMTAKIKEDGSYQVLTAKGAGLPLLTYQVAVCPPLIDAPTGKFSTPPKVSQFPNIPRKYRDPKTAGLSLQVHEGENRLDIEMTP